MSIQETATVNFDYEDILAQRSYMEMYGGNTIQGSYGLLGFAFSSHAIETHKSNETGPSWVTSYDIDFDLTFKTSQTIEGSAIINLTLGTQSGNIQHKVIIRKYSGTTETDLIDSGYVGSGVSNQVICHTLDIPKTKFKRNDKFRITVMIQTMNGDGGASHVYLCHDPANRASSYASAGVDTKFVAWIPFKPII